MKIVFLCSGAPQGRDGVGDYARLLAGQCARLGHETCVVALNDRACGDSQVVEDGNILRLPASLPWPQRVEQASHWIDKFAPDWISLQFVAYGFHPKGLVFGLGNRLASLCKGYRVQMMFHELWIGHARNSSLKDRLIGALQRQLILDVIEKVRPETIHANCSPFVAALQECGISATRLPLFGNIPVLEGGDNSWVFDAVRSANGDAAVESRNQWLLFGFFGAIRPQWSWDVLFPKIEKAARQAGKQVAVLSAGKLGSAGEESWRQMVSEWGGRFCMVHFGPQSPERVSEYLSALDFGILTSPRALIGKSGVVAAMIEHAVPVVVSRNDVHYPYTYDAEELRHPLIISPDTGLADELSKIRPATPEWSLPRIAEHFCESLENACEGSEQRVNATA